MELTADQIEWVERTAGGRIASVERQGRWRPHFFIEIEGPNARSLLLRMERDPETRATSRFAQRFDIEHEARVLSALQGTGVKIPVFVGYHEGSRSILMERVPGSNDISSLSEEARIAVLESYMDNLRALHSLDASRLDLDESPPDRSAEQLALSGKFAHAEADYLATRSCLRPEPLIEFARSWLHSNVPADRTRASLIQGDTGPGQFMVHDDKLSALIDWEISHLGDPMLDFGVMRMRNMLYPVGSLNALIDYYFSLSSEPRDDSTIIYYTVLSMLLSPMAMACKIQQPDPTIPAMLPRFGWAVTLRRGLCEALAEAFDVSIDPPSIPKVPTDRPRSDIAQFMVGFLEEQCLPAMQDDYQNYLMRSAIGAAQSAVLVRDLGLLLDSDTLDDMAIILGSRPADIEAGYTAISRRIENELTREESLQLLWLFTRMEYRLEVLWAPLFVAQKSRPLERLKPASRVYSPDKVR